MTTPLIQTVTPLRVSSGWRVTVIGFNLDLIVTVQIGGQDPIVPDSLTARELVFSVPALPAGEYSVEFTGAFGSTDPIIIRNVDLINLDPRCPKRYGAEEYTHQGMELLPPGQAWTRRVGSFMWKLINSLAEELSRIHDLGCHLLNETTPSQTVDSLDEWEVELGLPGECVGQGPSTDSSRRKEIFRKFNALGGSSAAYFEGLTSVLGLNTRVEEVYQTSQPFKAGISKAGDSLTQGPWLFTWRVVTTVPPSAIVEFKAGANSAGDPLRWWGISEMECLMYRLKPSHTLVIFSYISQVEESMIGSTGEEMAGNVSNMVGVT